MHTCMSELSKAQLTRSMKTNKTHLKTPFSSFFVFWRRKGVVEVIAICFQIVDIYVHFAVNFWTTFLDWPYFAIGHCLHAPVLFTALVLCILHSMFTIKV